MGKIRWRQLFRRIGVICYTASYWPSIADGALAGLIVVAGIMGLSPLAGIEAAGETIRARRRQRALKAAIRADHGAVWANHFARRAGQYARGIGEP